MVELLVEELGRAGLKLNAAKSKIFTLEGCCANSNVLIYADIADGIVEVVRGEDARRYLGIVLTGKLRKRGESTLAHRLKSAWCKFNMFKSIFCNRHVDIRLRLRFFDAVVTPSSLYGLSTAPLTAALFERLAVTQRKMLRLMVGYVKGPEDTWADMCKRLSQKIAAALAKFPGKPWNEELKARKQKMANKMDVGSAPALVLAVHSWDPASIYDAKLPFQPGRRKGRPPTSWHAR